MKKILFKISHYFFQEFFPRKIPPMKNFPRNFSIELPCFKKAQYKSVGKN